MKDHHYGALSVKDMGMWPRHAEGADGVQNAGGIMTSRIVKRMR